MREDLYAKVADENARKLSENKIKENDNQDITGVSGKEPDRSAEQQRIENDKTLSAEQKEKAKIESMPTPADLIRTGEPGPKL